MLRSLIVILISGLVAGAAHGQLPVRFKATVHSQETYVQPIGHGLYFVLKQSDGGAWDFEIRPSEANDESYTSCLTSPFLHGVNTVDLLAWRFAPDAPAGYAERPPVKMEIDFVTNAADQKYECANQDAMYNSFQRSQSAGLTPNYEGLPHYKPRPIGHSNVVVTAVSLKPGRSGSDAEFDSVTLEIRVTFPKSKRPDRH